MVTSLLQTPCHCRQEPAPGETHTEMTEIHSLYNRLLLLQWYRLFPSPQHDFSLILSLAVTDTYLLFPKSWLAYYEPTLWKREIKKPFFNWVWTYEIFCLQPDLFLVCGNFISYVKKQNKCLFLLYPIITNFLLLQTLNHPPRVSTVTGVNLKGKSIKSNSWCYF